ncbi:MAG: hypothetical protein WDZ51_15560 [Pirellulaceae bacterium]
MFPFHVPQMVALFAASVYVCGGLSVFWVRFAQKETNRQVAQWFAMASFLAMAIHMAYEITMGGGFWLAGGFAIGLLAVGCVVEPDRSRVSVREF